MVKCPCFREIGVHLAAKVFEEAVMENSSLVTNSDNIKYNHSQLIVSSSYPHHCPHEFPSTFCPQHIMVTIQTSSNINKFASSPSSPSSSWFPIHLLSPAYEQGDVRALQVRRDGGAQELHQVQENFMIICTNIKSRQSLKNLQWKYFRAKMWLPNYRPMVQVDWLSKHLS